MKLMIASDIHGSAYYCDKLLQRFEEEKPDRLILLGDYLYHGPRNDLPRDYNPKRVLTVLNDIKDYCIGVRGNCDAEVDQMVLEFPIMADYSYLNVDGLDIWLTHGHIYNEEKLIPNAKGIIIGGHTHVPVCHKHEDFIYLNPGSVSIPKSDSKYSYMIYEEGVFHWADLLNGERYDSYKAL